MKKLIAVIMSLTIAAALCACSENQAEISETSLKKPVKATTATVSEADEVEETKPSISYSSKADMTKLAETSALEGAALAEDNETSENDKQEEEKADTAETQEVHSDRSETAEHKQLSSEEITEAIYEAIASELPPIDKNIYSDLQNVLDKYGVGVSDLISYSGLSEDDFYFNWNNCDNQEMKASAQNYLFGKNYFENADTTNIVGKNLMSIKPLSAYWDNNGSLHILCSIKSGYRGITYNIGVDSFDVYSGGRLIASRSFGYITEPVDNIFTAETVQAIQYDTDFYYEFVFDGDSVNEPYANIMNDLNISYRDYSCNYYTY